MVSNDQRRRQLAREKFERQRLRREEARRRNRRRNAVVAAALAVALTAGGAVYASVQLTGRDADGVEAAAGPEATPSPDASSPPPEPPLAVDTKAAYTMTLKTNVGDLVVSMDAARTPRTVNSFKHLADEKYFDGTKCHRLTTQGIFVLQCGDPQGDGTGGPGYDIPDEDLASLGKAGPDGKVTFRAGTVAMANTGSPNSGGSQFFLVYEDSRLPPKYTPFGTLDAAGLKAVRDVAKAGVEGGTGDGAPKKPVTVGKATVSKR